jgi:acyl-CoA reductase-like NAD-dependent aldehyde dehydrogenase
MISLAADQVLARAGEAQRSWETLSVSRRCSFLGEMRREIAHNCESIAASIARETSKPLLDSLSGDVLVTLEQLRYYEAHAARILRPRRVSKPWFFFRGAHFEILFDPLVVSFVV